ncbi:MAG: hypothetical protein R3345_15020, partial [Fulvivirga sp.]|nr:hypothetical protein [Fulvivirga sp.]
VMVFAQPIIEAGEEGLGKSDVLIYLDNSYSMSNEIDESKSALDAGVTYIEALSALFPGDRAYQLLTNEFGASSRIPMSKTELNDRVTEIEYSSNTRSIEEVYSRILSQEKIPQNIFWISDFQKSIGAGVDEIVFDSSLHVNLVPLPFTSTKNVAVDSLWLENPFLIGDERLTLNVKIKNYGDIEINDLVVKVFVDDVQSATASINLAPNSVEQISFDLAFELSGVNQCRITFEEFPVTFDNEFYFVIDGQERVNVLEIKSTDDITSVGRVYGNEQLFNLTSINVANLDYNLISRQDLVILNGIEEIDLSLAAAINDYITSFGSVLLIPSPSPQIESYRQINGTGNLRMQDTTSYIELSTPDYENPFFEHVFEEKNARIAMPSGKKLLDWGRDRTAILSFGNGDPFLSQLGGRSNLFVLASPLSMEYTTFHTHALFVPVMYRLAVQSASLDNRLYYFVDEPTVSMRTDSVLGDDIFKLESEQGTIVPDQRVSGKDIQLEISPEILDAGFYDLILGENKITTLAFNKDFSESDLRQLTADEIKSIFRGNISLISASDKNDFAEEVKNKYIGKPLWKYALVLALFFLLSEVLLIRFFP